MTFDTNIPCFRDLARYVASQNPDIVDEHWIQINETPGDLSKI